MKQIDNARISKPASYYARKGWNWFIVSPVSALVVAIVVSGIAITILGYNPFISYSYLIVGAFGGIGKFVGTLGQMTPVLFTGMSHMIASRAGMSNLGMEGQFLGGAMAAALVALVCPVWLGSLGTILVTLFAGAAAGGFIALIPGILKRKLSSNEMLISLMLNYVVNLFTLYLLNNVVQNPDNITPATKPIPDAAKLPSLVQGTQFTVGFLIAIAIGVVLWVFLYRTVPGYKLRAIGTNASSSSYKGLNEKRIKMWAFIVAGLIAGIGGAAQVQGVHYCFIAGMSPGYGWDGVSAALLGSCQPVGVLFGALVFGALRNGSMYLSRSYAVPSDFIYMIEGIMMLFIAAPAILHKLRKNIRRNQNQLRM